MGTWNSEINSNDTAQDLKDDYKAAFFYNDVETAVKKIDTYVRKEMFDESDEEEWCNYIYSLADFMWKKGILTDEIRNKAVSMIDSGFGLDIWRESGDRALKKHIAALEAFKEQLLSPMPPKKKITLSMCMEPIFEVGDIIAMQLKTAGKVYAWHAHFSRTMTNEEYNTYDGKYIIIRKIYDDISYTSAIEPNVRDIYPVFQLFDVVYDKLPEKVELSELRDAQFTLYDDTITPLFVTEGAKSRYKKRGAFVLGNDMTDIEKYSAMKSQLVFLSACNNMWDFDSLILAAMKEVK